jgi:hypothetical protein
LSLATELPSTHFFVPLELIVDLVVIAMYVDTIYSYWRLRRAQIVSTKPSFPLPLLALFGLIAFWITITMFGDALIRRDSLVNDSLNLMTLSKVCQDALGEEVKAGWPIHGDYSVHGSNGQASLSIPVSGKHNRRIMYVTARKSGSWDIESLELSANGSRVHILQKNEPLK